MLDMGLRSVPIGEQNCYSYDIYTNTWKQLPDVPIGKMHPTLININSRYVFQIGGFDDFNFEIYRLDMSQPDKPWKTLELKLIQPIVNPDIYISTHRFLEIRNE